MLCRIVSKRTLCQDCVKLLTCIFALRVYRVDQTLLYWIVFEIPLWGVVILGYFTRTYTFYGRFDQGCWVGSYPKATLSGLFYWILWLVCPCCTCSVRICGVVLDRIQGNRYPLSGAISWIFFLYTRGTLYRFNGVCCVWRASTRPWWTFLTCNVCPNFTYCIYRFDQVRHVRSCLKRNGIRGVQSLMCFSRDTVYPRYIYTVLIGRIVTSDRIRCV